MPKSNTVSISLLWRLDSVPRGRARLPPLGLRPAPGLRRRRGVRRGAPAPGRAADHLLQARGGAALGEGGVVQRGDPGEGDLARARVRVRARARRETLALAVALPILTPMRPVAAEIWGRYRGDVKEI